MKLLLQATIERSDLIHHELTVELMSRESAKLLNATRILLLQAKHRMSLLRQIPSMLHLKDAQLLAVPGLRLEVQVQEAVKGFMWLDGMTTTIHNSSKHGEATGESVKSGRWKPETHSNAGRICILEADTNLMVC